MGPDAARDARAAGRSGAVLLLLLFSLVSAPLSAQVTPGAVKEQLPKPAAPSPAAAPPQPAAPKALKPVIPAGGPRIHVERFEFSGNRVFSDAALQRVIARYRGKQLTLQEIYAVADTLTDFYRAHGYALASVSVPPQKVSSGTVRFDVIEGRVGALTFQGNHRYSDGFLAAHLPGLAPGSVVTSGALGHDLLLLNDLPGLTANAVIKPGRAYGSSDLLIRSSEKPVDASARMDNYGRESVGVIRVSGDLFVNNLTGHGDRLGVSVLRSQSGRLNYGLVDYSLPVGVQGTTVTVSAARYVYHVATAKLGAAFAADRLTGDGDSYRVELNHPFIRSRRENLYLGLAFSRDIANQSGSGILTPVPPATFPERELNLLHVTGLYTLIHADNSITSISAEASTNFKANPGGTRNNAELGKFKLDVSHLQPITGGLSLYGRALGVASVDPLMDLDKFRLGGPTNVRGFPTAEVGGDYGYLLTAQANEQLRFFPSVPISARVYWDGGRVYRKVRAAGERSAESLASVGVGLTATFFDNYTLTVDAVRPMDNHAVSDRRTGGRIWAQVSANF